MTSENDCYTPGDIETLKELIDLFRQFLANDAGTLASNASGTRESLNAILKTRLNVEPYGSTAALAGALDGLDSPQFVVDEEARILYAVARVGDANTLVEIAGVDTIAAALNGRPASLEALLGADDEGGALFPRTATVESDLSALRESLELAAGPASPSGVIAKEDAAVAFYAGSALAARNPGMVRASLRSMLSTGSFPTPKLIRMSENGPEEFSPHNYILYSGDFTAPQWVIAGAAINDDGTLEATNSNPTITSNIPFSEIDRDMTFSVRVKAPPSNAAPFQYVELNKSGGSLGRVWIDMSDLTIAHVDPGLTAVVAVPPAGDAPLAGAALIVIGFTLPSYSIMYPTLGFSNASQATISAVGNRAIFEQPQITLGTSMRPYHESAAAPVDVPIDYATGTATVPIAAADKVLIPASEFPWTAGDPFGVFMRFTAPEAGKNVSVGMTQDGGNFISILINTVGQVFLELRTGSANDDRTGSVLGTVEPETKVDLVFGLGEEGFVVSLNREPPTRISRHALLGSGQYRTVEIISPASIEFNASGAGILGLQRLVMLDRAFEINGEEARTFGMTEPHPCIRATHPIVPLFASEAPGGNPDPQVPYVDRVLEGAVHLIDGGAQSGTAVLGSQSVERRAIGSAEKPGRLMDRQFSWSPGSPVKAGSLKVFDTPVGWDAGDGHMQHGSSLVRRYGPERGTEWRFYTELGDPPLGGDPESEPRNIYARKRTSRLDPWGPKVLILEPDDLGLLTPSSFVLTSPSGGSIQFPDDHPNAGRFGFAAYTFAGGGTQFVYSDDEGANWAVSPEAATKFGTVYGIESTPVLTPSGDVLLFSRAIAATLGKVWRTMLVSRLTGGGANAPVPEHVLLSSVPAFENQGGSVANVGHTLGYEGAAATCTAIQLDPEGRYDRTVGIVAIIAARNHPDGASPERHGLSVYFVGGPDYTLLHTVDLISADRTVGANGSTLIEMGGKQHLAIQAAIGIDGTTNARTAQELIIVEVPDWRDAIL